MDFHSRILHSLKPDAHRIWREHPRLNVEIRGWPKNIKWLRTSKKAFSGRLTDTSKFSLDKYATTLKTALDNIIDGISPTATTSVYTFAIGREGSWEEYSFYSKARTIAAFCVLYDLEPHPRNDLELNIPTNLGHQKWPYEPSNDALTRTYGDPSKTADVLRNEGWLRMGPDKGLDVFRERIGGHQQQMYKLLRTKQDMKSQRMRSNIPQRWRSELFKNDDYICKICHNKYEEEYLDPDHRIPVIYEADGLTEANYKDKLMTLCRYCNQAKREATKKFGHDYDWSRSPWAFPEKFQLEKISEEIHRYSKSHKISFDEVIKLIPRPKR